MPHSQRANESSPIVYLAKFAYDVEMVVLINLSKVIFAVNIRQSLV